MVPGIGDRPLLDMGVACVMNAWRVGDVEGGCDGVALGRRLLSSVFPWDLVGYTGVQSCGSWKRGNNSVDELATTSWSKGMMHGSDHTNLCNL